MATVQTTSRTADVISMRNFLRAFLALAVLMAGVGIGLVIGEETITDQPGQQLVRSSARNPQTTAVPEVFSPELVKALAGIATPEVFSPELARALAQPGIFLSRGQVADGLRMTAMAAALVPVDTFSPELARSVRYPAKKQTWSEIFSPEVLKGRYSVAADTYESVNGYAGYVPMRRPQTEVHIPEGIR